MNELVCYDMMKNFVPLQNYLKKKNDGEFTIVSNDKQEIYYLNDTARMFYNLCDGENTIDSIFCKMETEYDVDRIELMIDLVELVRNMQWQDIITLREERC